MHGRLSQNPRDLSLFLSRHVLDEFYDMYMVHLLSFFLVSLSF